MKYLNSKKIMIRLMMASILYVMLLFTAYGQDTATRAFTVTNIQSNYNPNASTYNIVGKDNEKEIKTSSNIYTWFENNISVENASEEFVGQGMDKPALQQFVVDIKYNNKLYRLKILIGMKLKYKMNGENAIILFDESYCLPTN